MGGVAPQVPFGPIRAKYAFGIQEVKYFLGPLYLPTFPIFTQTSGQSSGSSGVIHLVLLTENVKMKYKENERQETQRVAID